MSLYPGIGLMYMTMYPGLGLMYGSVSRFRINV